MLVFCVCRSPMGQNSSSFGQINSGFSQISSCFGQFSSSLGQIASVQDSAGLTHLYGPHWQLPMVHSFPVISFGVHGHPCGICKVSCGKLLGPPIGSTDLRTHPPATRYLVAGLLPGCMLLLVWGLHLPGGQVLQPGGMAPLAWGKLL